MSWFSLRMPQFYIGLMHGLNKANTVFYGEKGCILICFMRIGQLKLSERVKEVGWLLYLPLQWGDDVRVDDYRKKQTKKVEPFKALPLFCTTRADYVHFIGGSITSFSLLARNISGNCILPHHLTQ